MKIRSAGSYVLGLTLLGIALLGAAAWKKRRFQPQSAELISPKSTQAQSSQTPAEVQFAAWLEAFNAGDRDALFAYHQLHFPYEIASDDVANIDRELRLSQATGGFAMKQHESPAVTSIVATLKERHSEQFARAVMDVEVVEPHRVARFEIHPILTPDEFLSPEERSARLVDDAKRRSLIERIATELEAHYIFPDQATRMVASLREHLERGDYDKIQRAEEYADVLTRDLREVSHDLHLSVQFRRRRGDPESTREEPPREHPLGIGLIERLSGNVAHVSIESFPPVDTNEEREGIAALMSQVADADALVIDLRSNHGGSPDTVALVASYLFDETPVHLNDMFRRDTGYTAQSWTSRELRGTRFGSKKPVYVLTSRDTFSGGEEFAYDLQALRRATIVGETTGGGAHPMEPYLLDQWFQMRVPWGRPINPITKTNWEGVGVVPDVQVPAADALAQAHRRALDDIAGSVRSPGPATTRPRTPGIPGVVD
ncbi:MAG TPA: S41 family peptidase [Polyangiales bacterium]|nr:S41 family peptidase [Polyangiales bacterium]